MTTSASYTRTELPLPGTTVVLVRPLKSKAGNIIATAGPHELVTVEQVDFFGDVSTSYTIRTPEHYAGITLSSFTPRRGDRVTA